LLVGGAVATTKKADVINVHEAKTHLSRLLERAHQGEEIILAKAGKPYARLVPLEQESEREPGRLEGRIVMRDDFFEALPDDELGWWEGGE
jgi:prevent-host-death family protein